VDRLQDLNVFLYERKAYLNNVIDQLDTLLCDKGLPQFGEPIVVYRGLSVENFDLAQILDDAGYKSVSFNPAVALGFCK
jgi:hypothetical protein